MTNQAEASQSGDPMVADLDRAFVRETRIGVLIALGTRALWSAFSIAELVLNTIPFRSHMPANFKFPLGLVVFALAANLITVTIFVIALRSRRPLFWCAVSMVADFLIVSELKFFWLWSPVVMTTIPMFVEVRYLDIIAFFFVIAIYALPMSRGLVAASGGLAMTIWTAGTLYGVAIFPGSTIYWGPLGTGLDANAVAAILKPNVLVGDFLVLQVLLAGLFAAFLALSAGDARRYVMTRVRAEAERSFLARFFSPHMAERLAQAGRAGMTPARRRVAVLFVGLPPDAGTADFARLEAHYATVEQIAFAHGGVLDRISGGPTMVSFGALDNDGDAAAKALTCANEIAKRLAAEYGAANVGLHTGDAVCGDAGGAQSRIFSVVGDVVNTARRLLDEAQSRSLALVFSEQVRRASGEAATGAATDLGQVALRGRDTPLHLWSLAT